MRIMQWAVKCLVLEHQKRTRSIFTILPGSFASFVFSFPVFLSWSVFFRHEFTSSEACCHVLLFQIHFIHVDNHFPFLFWLHHRNTLFSFFAHTISSFLYYFYGKIAHSVPTNNYIWMNAGALRSPQVPSHAQFL